jgi:FtsH-binding integral membrane protein
MSSHDTALEHLRIIRSLMERAQTYRAISASAALFGGSLGTLAAVRGIQADVGLQAWTPTQLLWIWMLLLASSALNVALLARGAAQRAQPVLSEGMVTAMRAIAPPMLVGGVLGFCFIVYRGDSVLAALVWINAYALGLLATGSFSPRSIRRLGRAFLVAGLSLSVVWFARPTLVPLHSDVARASLFLGLTFGLLHIAYALAVFLRPHKPLSQVAE